MRLRLFAQRLVCFLYSRVLMDCQNIKFWNLFFEKVHMRPDPKRFPWNLIYLSWDSKMSLNVLFAASAPFVSGSFLGCCITPSLCSQTPSESFRKWPALFLSFIKIAEMKRWCIGRISLNRNGTNKASFHRFCVYFSPQILLVIGRKISIRFLSCRWMNIQELIVVNRSINPEIYNIGFQIHKLD